MKTVAMTVSIVFLFFSANAISFYSYDTHNQSICKNGRTLYVGGNGPNNYTTIQAAINAADDGDTIFVYSGRYPEDIYIWKNISLIGENKEKTIIELCKGELIEADSLSFLKIKDFTIKDGETVPNGAITICHSKNIEIENCIFLNNVWTSIQTFETNNVKILNCTFDRNLGGVETDYSYNILVYHCDFSNTVVDVYSLFSIGNRILECNFSDNINNNEVSIFLYYSAFCVIHHCNFLEKPSAYFINSFFNFWSGNYWNRPRILPKVIKGEISLERINIPWINIDLHPLKRPYKW